MQKPKPCPRRALVTEHAIVRYIERALKAPELIDSIVAHLLDEGRDAMVMLMDSGDIRIGRTDLVMRVREGKVISVTYNNFRPGHQPARKARRSRNETD